MWYTRWGFMRKAKAARRGNEKWREGETLSSGETEAVLWANDMMGPDNG